MSTRSAILRAGEGGGVGRYIHFDGYPTGVGLALLEIYSILGSNFRSMATTLIDNHPAGWSSIVNTDWSQEPGYIGYPPDPTRLIRRPQCYCHGDRSEPEQTITCVDDTEVEGYCTGESCDPLFIEWAYRILPEGLEVWEGWRVHPVTGAHAHRKVRVVRWDDYEAMRKVEEEVYG